MSEVQRVIASVSRNADGTIREVGARLVGERDELVHAFHVQLLAVARGLADPVALLERAKAEVDALLAGQEPPRTPVVATIPVGGAVRVVGPVAPPPAAAPVEPPAAPETPPAPPVA